MSSDPKYISPEQQAEFEQFLLQHMSLQEEKTFNEKLSSDSVLKSQFEEFKTMLLAVEEEGLRNAMNDFHKGLAKKKSNFTLYRIAAGIAILVSLGVWFFNQPSTNEKLFNEYFSPDPGLPTVMGSNDNYDFYEAMVNYKQGNYDMAISKWEKLLETKPENDTLNYFLGSAYLAIENEEQSIHHLQLTSKVKGSIFVNEAYLFLGMAHLKNGELQLAKRNLALSEEDKAKELLKKLHKE